MLVGTALPASFLAVIWTEDEEPAFISPTSPASPVISAPSSGRKWHPHHHHLVLLLRRCWLHGWPPEQCNGLLCWPPELPSNGLLCRRPPGRPPELFHLCRWPPVWPPELCGLLCCQPPGGPPELCCWTLVPSLLFLLFLDTWCSCFVLLFTFGEDF